MPKQAFFRTSDTCIDINCGIRRNSSRNIGQFHRVFFRRKFVLGVILGLIGAIMSDRRLQFIITGASDKGDEPVEYLEDYNSPGMFDESVTDFPVGIDNDTVEILDLNDTSLEDRTVRPLEHTAADVLFQKVKVLCWVLTSPLTHHTRAIHVKKTWGKRCNILLFMSTTNDTVLGTVALNITETRGQLDRKSREAFRYVYKHYRDQADWFLKADDDTYVVVENLRQFLSTQLPDEPIYFGCKFAAYVKQGYMSGGPGYVLSRTALEYMVAHGIEGNVPKCTRHSKEGDEDVAIGRCLESVGVISGDSRDRHGSYRFLPFMLDRLVNPFALPMKSWYLQYLFYPQPKGIKCCSDSAISFHYADPEVMYFMDYLVYRHRVMFDS